MCVYVRTVCNCIFDCVCLFFESVYFKVSIPLSRGSLSSLLTYFNCNALTIFFFSIDWSKGVRVPSHVTLWTIDTSYLVSKKPYNRTYRRLSFSHVCVCMCVCCCFFLSLSFSPVFILVKIPLRHSCGNIHRRMSFLVVARGRNARARATRSLTNYLGLWEKKENWRCAENIVTSVVFFLERRYRQCNKLIVDKQWERIQLIATLIINDIERAMENTVVENTLSLFSPCVSTNITHTRKILFLQ